MTVELPEDTGDWRFGPCVRCGATNIAWPQSDTTQIMCFPCRYYERGFADGKAGVPAPDERHSGVVRACGCSVTQCALHAPIAEVDAMLRAEGGDPVEIGERGERFVASLMPAPDDVAVETMVNILTNILPAVPAPDVQGADKLAGNSDVQARADAARAEERAEPREPIGINTQQGKHTGRRYYRQEELDAAVAREREACAAEVEAQIPYFDRVLEASTTIGLNAAARLIRARSGAKER